MTGDVTRGELARELGLSVGTVTNVVTDLINEGIVREAGWVPSNGGRPTARLKLVSDAAYFIGADVGEHGVEATLFNLALDSTDSVFIASGLESTSAEQIRAMVTRAVADLIARNHEHVPKLQGVGLGLPGIVDTNAEGTSVYAQSLGWPRIDLSELTPRLQVPVFADNGAKTFAMAEIWAGAAKDASHSLVVLLGRGVGAGIVTGGRLMHGATSSAGEWGHTKVVVNGRRCRCGGLGCLEAYVGGSAIRERAAEAGLDLAAPDEDALRTLLAASRDGSAAHQAFLTETLEYLAAGLANLVNLFNPQQIVIGGWAGHLMFSSHQSQIVEAVKHHALARPAEQITITESKCSVDPIALGAALLPLEHFIEAPRPRGAR
jgi:predicted NBD/HSP70 family sugar kinase